jgi:ribosomal protein L11 methyltransferase
MKWIEFTLNVPPEYVEPISHVFHKYGEGGIVVESPAGFNPDEGEVAPAPSHLIVRTYVPLDDQIDIKRSNIQVAVKLINYLHPIDSLIEKIIEKEDWESNWKKYFHPIRVGKNIKIVPTWIDYKFTENEIIVFLDPGMAFGTGHHPTTRMCIELLEEIIGGGEIIADVGCGSGILSIAAVKLGAAKSVGFEVSSDAVDVAIENCVINKVDEYIRIYEKKVAVDENIYGPFDIVVANISAKIIIELANMFSNLITIKGKMVLSGILEESLSDVETALKSNGIVIERISVIEDWVAILATKLN